MSPLESISAIITNGLNEVEGLFYNFVNDINKPSPSNEMTKLAAKVKTYVQNHPVLCLGAAAILGVCANPVFFCLGSATAVFRCESQAKRGLSSVFSQPQTIDKASTNTAFTLSSLGIAILLLKPFAFGFCAGFALTQRIVRIKNFPL